MDRTNLLGEEKISKLLLKFSLPAIVGMLVTAFYSIIARVFIGNSIGSLGIAAITIGFPIMMVQMAFGGLIGIGATSLVSIRLGQKRTEEAEVIMGNSFTMLGVVAILITFFGVVFLEPILTAFGASPEVLPYAKDYMGIILYGSIFQSLSFGLNNFIRAEGKPTIAMATLLISAILNTALAPLFIFTFGWGMKGAAIATVISQAVSAVWIVSYFVLGKSTLKIRVNNLKLRRNIVIGTLSIGIAPFAMQAAQSVLSILLNISLKNYGGDVAISGMGLATSLITIVVMPLMGINQGSQPIIGYNYGARKNARVTEIYKKAITTATVIALVGYLVTMLFPTQLISMFNANDKEMIAFGSLALKASVFFLPIIGFQIISAGYFQAVGKPLQSMMLNLSRQVLILIPLLLILPKFMGLNGVLYSTPIADLLATLIAGVFIYKEFTAMKIKEQRDASEADRVMEGAVPARAEVGVGAMAES